MIAARIGQPSLEPATERRSCRRRVTQCCNRDFGRHTLGQEMTEPELRELLLQETLGWAERSPAEIVAELAKPQTHQRGTGDAWHEIEVTLLEATDDYIHVKTSIHDGSLVWALKPITSSFLIYRDGRIEL